MINITILEGLQSKQIMAKRYDTKWLVLSRGPQMNMQGTVPPALNAQKTAPENFMGQKQHHHLRMLPEPPSLAAMAHSQNLPKEPSCVSSLPPELLPNNQVPVRKNPGSFVPQSSARPTLGNITQYQVVGHMVVQLTLCDAGQLLLLIRVSPSHGYTMAFRLHQGTFDL